MTELRPPDLVHGQLEAAAAEDPGRTWLRFVDGESLTLGDLSGRVRGIACQLQALGVDKGDRVAYMLGNSPPYVESWLAAHAIGAVSVPLSTALRGDLLLHLLELVTPKVLIVEADLLERVSDVIPGRPWPETAVVVGDSGPYRFSGRETIPFERLCEPGDPRPVALEAHDPCCVMYTSGTTGPSKGVTFTNFYTVEMARTVSANMRYDRDDTLYTCLPLFHSNALHVSFVPALIARSGFVVGRRFSVSGFWREVATHEATATNLLGAMTPMLLSQPPSEWERRHALRTALVIPAAPEFYTVFPERFGFDPVEAYGLTDFGMLLWAPPDEPARPGSCGRPVANYELRLVDEDDREVAQGEVGELVARPRHPWVTSPGYWGMPDETLDARRNLWFHTGDLMRRDADDWFYFVDRGKDAIRRRGENVSCFEVEQVLLQHPAVRECAAYALPSDLSEDEVAVAVVLEAGAQASARELTAFAEPKLPYYALPRYVRLLSELPKTQTEKVRKQELRDAGVAPDTWDREEAGYDVVR